MSIGVYDGGERLSMGRPIPGVRVYLIDLWGAPAALGAAGELWVGGVGLAHGYLEMPHLTAERFVPDPFSGLPGERLYRTGDLARFRSDGELEFLGRADSQVKLRGFRVEPGEVEAALADHPGVRDAAVVVQGSSLVAFVVRMGDDADAAGLRGFLKSRLPDFMVPGRFAFLDALPQTPAGKVDRAGLARRTVPDEETAESGTAAAIEASPAGEILAGIFADVLGRSRVGADDDFFALGGHSLLATQAASRIREAFGVEMPLRALFESPTPAGLAGRMEELLSGGSSGAGAPILPMPPERRAAGNLPLSFAQQRLWVFEQLHPGTAAYSIPMAIRLLGGLDAGALRAAFEAVAARHEVLRTGFREIDGSPVQAIEPAVEIALPRIDLTAVAPDRRETEVRAAVRALGGVPFDLGRPPLMRTALLDLAPGESVLVLVLHHIVADGWSMGILVRELTALYRGFLRGFLRDAPGEPAPLPDLPVQYADFAAWQQERLIGAELDRLLGWWTLRLSGAPPRLELPFARPAGAQRFRGAARSRAIGPELAGNHKALGRGESATLFMVLLAGFQALLSIRGGGTDIVVGTDVANRNRAETEGLIGFFINQLALRTDLSGNPTFRELLARVRETSLGAFAHQDLPFDRLVDALGVPRDLGSFPIFQAKLNLQNAQTALDTRPVELPGLRLQPLAGETGTSQLALNLRVAESPAGLACTLEHDTDLFEAEAIDRLLGELEALLAAVAARPETRLDELAAALDQAERGRRAEKDREIEGADRAQLRAFRRPAGGRRPAS